MVTERNKTTFQIFFHYCTHTHTHTHTYTVTANVPEYLLTHYIVSPATVLRTLLGSKWCRHFMFSYASSPKHLKNISGLWCVCAQGTKITVWCLWIHVSLQTASLDIERHLAGEERAWMHVWGGVVITRLLGSLWHTALILEVNRLRGSGLLSSFLILDSARFIDRPLQIPCSSIRWSISVPGTTLS